MPSDHPWERLRIALPLVHAAAPRPRPLRAPFPPETDDALEPSEWLRERLRAHRLQISRR